MNTETLIAEARAKIATAMSTTVQELDTDKFAAACVKQLKARQSDVIWKLLGLDDRWGKWEVDHCNGRNSRITEYLSQASKARIEEWLNQAIAETLNSTPAPITKALRDEVRRRYQSTLNRTLLEAAEQAGRAHAEKLMEQLQAEITLETEEAAS